MAIQYGRQLEVQGVIYVKILIDINVILCYLILFYSGQKHGF